MAAKNQVIAGEYEGKYVAMSSPNKVVIVYGFFKKLVLDKTTVESYEVMDEESRKSATSAVGRGLLGGFLLGPVGMLAGLSAKKKGVYVIAIQFHDGKKSLIEVNDKIYKVLMKVLF